MVSRRNFLISIPLGAAATTALGDTKTKDPLADMLVVNTLGMPQDSYARDPELTAKEPVATPSALEDNLRSSLTAMNVTVGYRADYDHTIASIRQHDAFIAENADRVRKILNVADIIKAKKDRKLGLIYGFQNAAMVGDELNRIDEFAGMGLRIIQLTYNDLNQLGGGSLSPGNEGLSPFGHAVVERLNGSNIIVDLSHSGQQLCLDATRTSKKPVCITHTGCAAVAPHPRNKTNEELRLIAQRGGYIGIYFMPYLRPGRNFSSEDVIAHIDHAINVCGEGHVGIGSDHGVDNIGPLDMVRSNYEKIINDRRAKGISAPGEDPKLLPYASDLIGPEQFRVLARGLAARGYSSSRIEKIMGKNFIAYAAQIWA